MTVLTSLFAALIAVGALIAIPIGSVPIVLQNFFVLLSGLLLGRHWALGSVLLYLFAGALGLPVFAGAKGGIGHLMGFTGGYLVGYLPAVYAVALISGAAGHKVWRDGVALLTGTLIIYIVGVAWLMLASGMPLPQTLAVGVLPFLPGDIIKIIAALLLAPRLRPFLHLH